MSPHRPKKIRVGAIIVLALGVSYMMSQDGSYSQKTTSSEGKEVYQSVPPPQGECYG